MTKFNRVAIIGVGLIGGSLGLVIRKKHLARDVVGVCRSGQSVRLAKKIGAIDWGTTQPLRAIEGAEFVILATPIRAIPGLARRLAPHLGPGAILTDVASAKGTLVQELEEILPKDVAFVGSHPMAGRETKGVAFATPGLFQGKICFVIQRPHTPPSAPRTVSDFWRRIGACVKVISVTEHDRLAASLSHLPHLVAALLVLNAKKVEWAGTGFRDMTRIVSSDPRLWREILVSNQKEILKSLGHFRRSLDRTAALLQKKKETPILNVLKKAKRIRDRLNRPCST